jgi:hypothetical protein
MHRVLLVAFIAFTASPVIAANHNLLSATPSCHNLIVPCQPTLAQAKHNPECACENCTCDPCVCQAKPRTAPVSVVKKTPAAIPNARATTAFYGGPNGSGSPMAPGVEPLYNHLKSPARQAPIDAIHKPPPGSRPIVARSTTIAAGGAAPTAPPVMSPPIVYHNSWPVQMQQCYGGNCGTVGRARRGLLGWRR